MLGNIHSLESFGTVDGPGIRYVVFLQGCPLRCQYCHNPDTWDYANGKTMSVDEILDNYEGVREFHRNGGITVTGGEPLIQMDFVIELFKKAKNKDIHTCIDTSGITFNRNEKTLENFDKLLEVTDLFLLDIKHIDNDEHIKLTGQENTNILDFALYLCEKNKPVWIRHVVVPEITTNETYLHRLGMFLGNLKNLKALDILPYHDMGKEKYHSLNIPYPLENTLPLDEATAAKARDIVLEGIKDCLRQKKKEL